MENTLKYAVLSLSAIGTVAAIILFFIAQKFKVEEDPRIDEVEETLPAANCGGCGYPGCRNFAEACVNATDLSNLKCPAGGAETMQEVAKILGLEAAEQIPMIAVVKCSGSLENRPKTTIYDSAKTCQIASSVYSGDTGCEYGCLSHGDCVTSCLFDAIHMNKNTGLPEVDQEKCTACNACVKACPNNIIELRKKGPKDRRVFVSCINQEKGGIARKSCKVACIGCMKCQKECPFDAIVVDNFIAYIDFEKCKLCRKCVSVCPTSAILETNFPPKKIVEPIKEEVASTETNGNDLSEEKDSND